MRKLFLVLVSVIFLVGCTTDEQMIRDVIEDYIENTDIPVNPVDPIPAPLPIPDIEPAPTPIPEPVPTDTFDLNKVKWLHTNVSGWDITTTLTVSVDDNFLHLDYQGVTWHPVANLSGNLWVFLKYQDKWYGATCEWLRHNQSVKQKKCVNGDHIKQTPLQNWAPTRGETLYFMVSGLCRDSKRNVQQRSNLYKVIWR